jgi:hypothetical protein
MSTIPALTPEMRQALDANGGLPIQVTDPQTQKVYLLMEQEPADKAYEEYVRRELDKGLADIDAGRVVAWDPESIKREGRERLAARGIQPSKAD